MADAAKKRATYDDVARLPPEAIGEILNGELHVQPRPAGQHARAASRLGAELGGPFDRGRGGPGGWILLDEPELHLGEHVLVPDLAGWRRERLPEPPKTPYFEVAPDWVCEVLSPHTAGKDRTVKLPIYAQAEVAFAWLISPTDRTLEVFRRQGAHWLLVLLAGGSDRVRAEPFDAYELSLDELWAW